MKSETKQNEELTYNNHSKQTDNKKKGGGY